MVTPTMTCFLDPARAKAMATLVELEAQWEAMPLAKTGKDVAQNSRSLMAKQRAFDAYRTQLLTYNGQFKPAYYGETSLGTPARLQKWCRRMQDVYIRLEDQDPVRSPEVVVEKAYRCAERIAVRMNREPIDRAASPFDLRAAIRELARVADWCQTFIPEPTIAAKI